MDKQQPLIKEKSKRIQQISNNNYAGDAIHDHRAIEFGNRQIAEKEIKQQNENL